MVESLLKKEMVEIIYEDIKNEYELEEFEIDKEVKKEKVVEDEKAEEAGEEYNFD